MKPLIEILLAVATYYPCGSDPHRGPVEMLEGLSNEWYRLLDMAVEEKYDDSYVALLHPQPDLHTHWDENAFLQNALAAAGEYGTLERFRFVVTQ